MATAKPVQYRERQPSRWKRNVLVLAVLAAAFALGLAWSSLSGKAKAKAAYAARVGCSCHFISGLDLDSCEADLGSGSGPISLRADEEAKSVTARYPLMASQTATYRPGPGCQLEAWDE